ncbi:hypothetical protein [uncultured Kordia sp.]|uniref:hypothetical protein n=1 Tax=uncultured Kordia sp. TaxID=507699 RepID=UPI0026111391|nr:hypothetical protein [uncultured Kordia sp.]
MKKIQFKKQLFFLSICLLVFACKEVDPNKQIDEGYVSDQVYTSKEIGWQILIPNGWDIVTKEQSDQYSERGKEIFKEGLGVEIDDSQLKDLISFKKNQFNIFISSSEPFKEDFEGEWEQNNADLKYYLYEMFKNNGVNVDSTATTTVRIDGLDFKRYGFTIKKTSGEVILNQLMYIKLINGHSFSVNINYNNERDKKVMLKALFDSQFRK